MSARCAVLITGGGKRVGAVLCELFAKNGYDVALHYNVSEKEAREVKKQIESLGAKCELFQADLADISKLPALIASVKKKFPHCDALINNASIFERAGFLQTDEALFDRQVGVNFKAPFFLTQAFAQKFDKGSVVNILDTDIAQTQGSHFIYLQSKKMLADFTQMAARELGPNIRVNAVCPGSMMAANDTDAAYIHKLQEKLPAKRRPTAHELAESALFLCQNSSITGQLLFIDGGQHLL